MAEKKSVKRKVITAVVIVGVFALLIGSFFLRDICLRAGNDIADYKITAAHGGLFEKSVINADENGEPLYDKLTEELDVLCHTYCYGIEKQDNAVHFSFNTGNTKQLIYSAKDISDNETSSLGDNWYYYEKVMTADNG